MAETHDFLALDWVKGEIDETLKQAQQALEAHVENPEDQTRLRFCLTYLHQVYGTLQMVEFYGAALLAEEMEKLVQAMLAGKVSRLADAQETLMRGMLQMPAYLDRIRASRKDMPVILMPLLNDLRAARGEKLLSEGALFKPDMAQANQVANAAVSIAADPQLAELLRKLRQMFQLALLGVIRGDNMATNVGYMAKVAAKLDRVSGQSAVSPLWKVVGAVVEGVSNASIDNSTAIKLLLGQVDRVIRSLVEQGVKGFENKPPADLLKNLLFYVARSTAQSPLIKQVRATYKLDEALVSEEAIDAERAAMAGPDRQTMATVAAAISEELTRIKDALDIFMRGGAQSKIGDLAPHLPTLLQVADTIAMLGMGAQRKLIIEQYDLLDSIIRAGKLDDPGKLMDIAGSLLYVEATLASLGDRPQSAMPESPQDALTHDEINKARDAVVRECRAGLEFTKEKIVEYIASQWERSHVDAVPETLTGVRGGLQIIGFDRAAAVLVRAVDFVREQLLADDAQPDWKRMDTLADAISSVEYYLERALDDAGSSGHILDIAEKAVADLGYDVPAPVAHESAGAAPAPAASVDALAEEPAIDEFVAVAAEVAPAGEEPEVVGTPVLEDEFSTELEAEPTLDVPMTAAAEGTRSFADDEVPLLAGDYAADDVPVLAAEAPAGMDAGAEDVLAIGILADDVAEEAADEVVADPFLAEGIVAEAVAVAEATGDEQAAAGNEMAGDQVAEAVVAEPAGAGALSAADEADDEAEDAAVDEEIVEIFVEEIGEVMEKLNEFFPQWVANQDDEESLKEFRRAFHTLKGSGRMVGAKYVGELGWSIENMLNRVIDKTATPTPVMIELIKTVQAIVPELVDAFAKRRKPPYVVEPLMACAGEFAAGGQPAAVPPLQRRGARPAVAAASVALVPEELPAADELTLPAEPEATLPEDLVVDAVAVAEEVDDQEFGGEEAAVEEWLAEPVAGTLADDFGAEDRGDERVATEAAELVAGLAAEELAAEDLAGDLAGDLADGPGEDLADSESIVPVADISLPEEELLAVEALPDEAESLFAEDVAAAEEIEALALADDLALEDVVPVVTDFAMEPAPAAEVPEIDRALIEIFSAESEQHLATINGWLAALDPDMSHFPLDDDLLRALHTLKGSARMAGIFAVADIAGPTEKFCKEMRNNGETADAAVVALVREATALISYRILHLLPDPYAPIPGTDAFLAHLDALAGSRQQAAPERQEDAAMQAVQPRPGVLNELLAEGLDHVLDGADFVVVWAQQGVDFDVLAAMCAECAVLDAAATRGDITPVARLARRLRAGYEAVRDGRLALAPDVAAALAQGHESIVSMMDCMAALQSVWPAADVEQALDAVLVRVPAAALPAGLADVPVAELSFDEVVLPTDDELVAGDVAMGDDYEFSADDFADSEVEVLALTGTVEPTFADDYQQGPPAGPLLPESEAAAAVEALSREEFSAEEPVAPDRDAPDFDAPNSGAPDFHASDFDEVIAADVLPEELSFADVPVMDVVEEEVPAAVALPLFEDEPAAVAVPDAAAATVLPAVAAAADEAPPEIPDRDPELVEIFLEEADEIVESAGESLDAWIGNVENSIEVQKLQRDLHTLKGGARMAEVAELGDLAHELENLYEGLSHGTLSATPALFDLLHRCHDRIADMVGQIRSKGWCRNGNDLIGQIHAYIRDPENFSAEILAVTLTPVGPAAVPAAVAAPASGQAPADASPAVQVPAVPAPAAQPEDEPGQEVDADILEIFLEEAEDLTAQLDAAISGWRAEPTNATHPDELKRLLHTLKGGARLAGLKRLGDVSHHFETRVVDLGSARPGEAFFAEIHGYHDDIAALVERVRAGGVAAAMAAAPAMPAPEPAAARAVAAPAPLAAVEPAPVVRRADADDNRRAPAPTAAAARQAQPQEMVKVPSDLLEKLVNLAGETSINRSRIEQQVNDYRYSLMEMGSTISRLAEQLRRLNAEADEQVKANWEAGRAEGKYSGDFDPLEMDQYSALHQLTKQLFESASDLLDIRDTLTNKSRDTETLLLQQARVNTELQEGLMRSRMVPFSRLIPRLRRIVRQVSGELKKNIEIDFINPEGEMDRTLLERIVAPLEHMLRNACDHGVEDPQTRMAAGKPAQGRIRLALSREGGEVVLTIADDGKGINVNAVRKKAMERGLMDETSELSELEIMQFILEAGFSTAEKVTQISGRGVGMDVVSSEIKQMGGALTIRSEVGVGTTFEIRLPFTVSVNRALMVRVGEDQFAIPLVQIEGIVRVSPYELETYYQPDAPAFEYAGEHYRLNYLGGFVHGVAAPDLHGVTMPLPVLLVRGSEHTVAVQVDQLIGSREVVVKAVGPQLATVAGISGATILGDGRVVIILDLMSLIRAAHLQHEMHLAQQRRAALQAADTGRVAAPAVRQTPLIMVTDDSVTVRKVTGRFLERQGFEVVTAKDGMDAVAQLGDIKPDLMLLDIEMPRMDGFEVASHCRHDSRLKDLPIIMITSRTGEKHRERAMEIGVNAYMGKPFQEAELLAKINELLAERRAQALH